MLIKNNSKKFINRGAALITALLFVVLSVSISTILFMIMQVELGFADLMISGDRVQNSLKYVETNAMALLNKRNSKNQSTASNLNQQPVSEYSFKSKIINYVKVSGELEIQSGKFNVNYLYDKQFCDSKSKKKTPNSTEKPTKSSVLKEIFTNILISLEPVGDSASFESITPEVAKKIIFNIQSWMCPVDSARGKSMAGPYNNVKNQDNAPQWPYRSSSQKLVGISELKLIKGISEPVYDSLIEKVSVWPTSESVENVKFDVRFLSPSLFAAILGSDVTSAKSKLKEVSEIKTVDSKRRAIIKIIQDSGAYSSKEKLAIFNIIKNLLGTEAKLHYLLYSAAIQGRFNITAYTMISYQKNANIEWRSFGVL